jgi:linoleoyl-CoA desaturase
MNPQRPKIVFRQTGRFQAALKERVGHYFETRGIRPRDNWQMYLKTGIILAWVACSYMGLLWFAESWQAAIPLTVSLALAFSAVGFNIQHDGAHRAYSNSKIINWCMGFTMDLVGGSNVFWRQKHNVLHHTYTNINGADLDIYDGTLFRLSPEQPHRWIHRFQHIYTYALYAFLSLKWIYFDDWKKLFEIKSGREKFPAISSVELTLLFSTKAFHLLYAVVLPLFFHPLWVVIVFNLIFHFVLGFTLSVVFQMAHAVGAAAFPVPNENNEVENDWAAHQVETTANFAPDNPIVGWFTGGLNFQIEHHLFPKISHIHYRGLSAIVEKTCREFGVRYHAYPNFVSGFVAHYKWLRQMGRPASG